jgi:hypothetical protein
MVLVQSALATVTKICSDLMYAAVQSVWIQLDIQGIPPRPGSRGPPGTCVLVCGMYREWSDWDGIPVAVLKIGYNTLARPISHMVNMSLLAGLFPSAFKTALIHPVYKGGGEARSNPASYRPVAILCALSKVLETVAKEDLEFFMKAKDILSALQHCFRKGRSCTTALATDHAAWVSAKAKAKVVAVVGFDLSAAFDTVGREDLLPKMSAMGIKGKAVGLFYCYLTNAKQCVVWDGQVSDVSDVEYGFRQGSLLGPVLYLLQVSDIPLALEIRESDGDRG